MATKHTLTLRSCCDGAGPPCGGIPLEEYRREVLPGWTPNDPSYPLKLFLERLKIHRTLDGPGSNPTLHYEEHKMDDDASSWSMVSDYWMDDPWYDSYYYDEMGGMVRGWMV